MSARAHLPPEWTQGRVCACCGTADWAAVWIGVHDVAICHPCAAEVLPRLIADATWRSGPHAFTCATDVVERVQKEYWRAVAINALHDRKVLS
jgi:hypothetical protein